MELYLIPQPTEAERLSLRLTCLSQGPGNHVECNGEAAKGQDNPFHSEISFSKTPPKEWLDYTMLDSEQVRKYYYFGFCTLFGSPRFGGHSL